MIPLPHDRLRLLGAFQLVLNDEPIMLGQARLEELIAFLALRPGVSIHRAEIAFQFWPDSSEKQARTNLRKTLVLLRRRLPDLDAYLQIERQQLQWRTDAPCVVDAIDFQSELTTAQVADNPLTARQHLENAADLYGGELLPGCYEWRWRIRLLHIQALCHLKLGQPARALAIAEEGAALARHTSARKYIALFHEVAGAALAIQEEWTRADAELAAVVRVADEIECRPISWRARVRWAEVRRQLDDEQRADTFMAEANAIFASIATDVSDDALRALFLATRM